jgi:hypothetical protein
VFDLGHNLLRNGHFDRRWLVNDSYEKSMQEKREAEPCRTFELGPKLVVIAIHGVTSTRVKELSGWRRWEPLSLRKSSI